MGTQLRGVCDAFEVTVAEPRRGDREVQIDVAFTPGGPTDAATIELRLYSRRLGWVVRKESKWDREAVVPGTKARLERGKTGRLSFTRPLPPFVTAYRGTGLELSPVVVTEGDDGSALHLLLQAPPVAEDAYLVVRALPLDEQLRSTGLLTALRRRRPVARFEEAGAGAVAVTVESAEATSGRVRLEAVEHEHNDGSDYEWEPPIVTTEAALVSAGGGRLRADLPLPGASAAPASIECSRGADTQGIRWFARFRLEDARGKALEGQVQLHVGVERP